MKYITLLTILLLSISNLTASTQALYKQKDKQQHFLGGLIIYGSCISTGYILNIKYLNKNTCLVPVILAGIGKEMYDLQHLDVHTPEFNDAMVTILPSVLINFSLKF
jgi:hypothetical protein